MSTRFAKANGIHIAYCVQGEGPPLVLVMGYRLNSAAWPASFIEQLACRFTVVTLDNRGTGRSDQPVEGYALANMARDVCGVLDELAIVKVSMLGYSMGGAIAQEFVRQFPERVSSLILCATLAGGPQATYARSSVVSVMRDLDGLSPEQAARRIWKVTYAPGYLERHRTLAEDQMRREIALPTPLHAADLQFQAFAEFDGSDALTEIRCPTLILTGDRDELIPPQNSLMMSTLIPHAKLAVIPGGGHRVLWEATEICVDLITRFLLAIDAEPAALLSSAVNQGRLLTASHPLTSAIDLFATWPFALARAGFESFAVARQLIVTGSASRFGDGKPIVLMPRFLGNDFALLPLSLWLKALGYRPVTVGLFLNLADSHSERSLSRAIRETARRAGRKAVLMTHSSGMSGALRTADSHREWISDVVIYEALRRPDTPGVRTHFVASGWSVLHGMIELPQLLRSISIELIEESGQEATDIASHPAIRSMAEDEQT